MFYINSKFRENIFFLLSHVFKLDTFVSQYYYYCLYTIKILVSNTWMRTVIYVNPFTFMRVYTFIYVFVNFALETAIPHSKHQRYMQ